MMAIASAPRRNKCSVCREASHTKRNCPRKAAAGSEVPIRANGRVPNPAGKYRQLNDALLEDEDVPEQRGALDGSEDGSGSSEEEKDDQLGQNFVWEDVFMADLPDVPHARSLGLPMFIRPDTGIGCPTNIELPIGDSPLDHLRLFITEEMMESFVTATNAYGNMRAVRGWKDTHLAEFQSFLGIIVHLGIITYPSRKHIWSTGPMGSHFVRQIMTKHRFDILLKCWRFVDYSQYTDLQIALHKQTDPFWVVTSFCEQLSRNFEAMWTPGQFIDIDEQCIPWKGRHKCRCYNPNKPEKWHFKVYSLNCSRTGYQVNFHLYRGKAENRPEGISATSFPCQKLLQNEKYHHRNYIMFTDNWINSSALNYVY